MHTAPRLSLFALALAACALPARAQSSAPAWHPPLPAGFQGTYLNDRWMGMDAYLLVFPMGWHAQGVVHQGNPCFPVGSPVFRITSPDGLSMLEKLPPLAWSFGYGPHARQNKPGCIPLDETMGAQDFLKALSAEMKVEYAGDVPIPDSVVERFRRTKEQEDQFWRNKYRAAGMRPPDFMHDRAIANVRFVNGSYKMHGQMVAEIECQRNWVPDLNNEPFWNASCKASVRYAVAPEARFGELLKLTNDMVAWEIPEWSQAVTAQQNQRAAMMMQMINMQTNAAIQAQNIRFQTFNQQQQATQIQHEQFLQTLQRGTDISMQNAANIANAQHTITSDWVDLILDQQTVRDPTTGETAKVASGYNYVWRNTGTNQTYQTADPNANPNGSLDGSWVMTPRVHGDGTP